eukprot:TRINITY_DN2536_c0_g1_i6.p1 TRINITY_DN2536_c0_g1~~TRINITY_DN2536_c0_g1_i6.p1  ORF type:complete len:298 (-),score=46.09 TRINITY_DN2536_c0_g1_i6:62-955(-)
MHLLFKHHPQEIWNSMTVCYVDDEGDKCVVSSDVELQEAITLARLDSDRPLLKLLLQTEESVLPKVKFAVKKCRRSDVLYRTAKMDGLWKEGLALMEIHNYATAKVKFEEQLALTRRPHRQVSPLYNIACCEALMGNHDSAIAYLQRAFECGLHDVQFMKDDQDLYSLRELPGFKQLIIQMEARSLQPDTCRMRRGGKINRNRHSPAQKCTKTDDLCSPSVPQEEEQQKPIQDTFIEETIVISPPDLVPPPSPGPAYPYGETLTILMEMGFVNMEEVLRALDVAEGAITEALQYLLK